MNTKLKQMLKGSSFARAILLPYRLKLAFSYYYAPIKNIFRWLIKSREYTNLTYDLEDLNKDYLVNFISVITGTGTGMIRGYIKELEDDENLKSHIKKIILAGKEKYTADPVARYGRRLGWYAFVRAMKPKIIVESGVDKGLGACVLTAALMKNEAEGFRGFYYGIDINNRAGYLLKPPYDKYGKILYGDSLETIEKMQIKIDLYINDSDHSAEYEMREYTMIKDRLSNNALIIGDNAHTNNKLYKFAEETKRDFLFFQEKPKAHWYPGGGMGVAFLRPK